MKYLIYLLIFLFKVVTLKNHRLLNVTSKLLNIPSKLCSNFISNYYKYNFILKNHMYKNENKKKPIWAVFGDSLTEYNFRAKYHYFDYVAKELNLEIINLGISSTGYKEDGNGIAFYKRMKSSIENLNFDVLTIFGSFNDLGKGFKLGKYTDSTDDTICGCINLTIDIFKKTKPLSKIALVTPTIWRDGVYYGNYTVTRNDLDDYVDALLNIARYRRIPILDLYHNSGLDPNNNDVLLNFYNENGIQDQGVHPNSLGHKFMYPMWREFIKNFIELPNCS